MVKLDFFGCSLDKQGNLRLLKGNFEFDAKVFLFDFTKIHGSLFLSLSLYIYIYIYIYMFSLEKKWKAKKIQMKSKRKKNCRKIEL